MSLTTSKKDKTTEPELFYKGSIPSPAPLTALLINEKFILERF